MEGARITIGVEQQPDERAAGVQDVVGTPRERDRSDRSHRSLYAIPTQAGRKDKRCVQAWARLNAS